MKKSTQAIILLLLLITPTLRSQIATVKPVYGSSTEFDMGLIRRMTITNDDLSILFHVGYRYSFAKSQNLKSITFRDSPTSISPIVNYNNSITLSLYPNPTSGEISLLLEGTVEMISMADILSLDGKLIRHERFSSALEIPTINLADLPKGFYLCRVTYNSKVISSKFLKL